MGVVELSGRIKDKRGLSLTNTEKIKTNRTHGTLSPRLTHNPAFQWRPLEVGGGHTCNFKQSVLVHGTYTPEQLEEIFVRTQVLLI